MGDGPGTVLPRPPLELAKENAELRERLAELETGRQEETGRSLETGRRQRADRQREADRPPEEAP